MKFHKNKLLTTVSAIALVLAVGACSSSGDDEMALVVNGDGAATNGGDAATNGGDAATNGGDDTKTPAQTLADARDALKELPADATDDARAEAMTALVAALMLEGNEPDYLAYLEKKVDDQAQAIKDEDAADAAEKASDMAKAVHKAIGTDIESDEVNPAAPPVKLAASSASVLTAMQTGYRMSSTPPDGITGWRGATLDKDGDTTVIYTDIADSVAKKIGDIYDSASGPGEPEHFDVVTDPTGLNEHDIPWSKVKRSDDESITTTGDDAKTTFLGTVSDLPGTFTCTAQNCVPPSGETLEGTDWTFTPTDPEGTIDVPDSAYISFGWWLNAMGTMDAYAFDAFASVEGMDARTVGATVEGSATYKGAAAGKWAMQSTSDDSASGGHFTATATLTADFDASSDPVSSPDDTSAISIGGTITNFMTGDVSRPNWKVKLTAPDAATDIPVGGVSGETSWTTGGAVSGTGEWNAIFYGGMPDDQPAAAAGEFDAAIPASGEIGRISGAFGANKVAE